MFINQNQQLYAIDPQLRELQPFNKKRKLEQERYFLSDDRIIPDEVISIIFSYLIGSEQLKGLSLTNRRFQEVFKELTSFGKIFTAFKLAKVYFYSNQEINTEVPQLEDHYEIPMDYKLCKIDECYLHELVIKSLKNIPSLNTVILKVYDVQTVFSDTPEGMDWELIPSDKDKHRKVKSSALQFTSYLIKNLFQRHLPIVVEQLFIGKTCYDDIFWDLEYAKQVNTKITTHNQEERIPQLKNIEQLFACIDHMRPTVEMIQDQDWSLCYTYRSVIYKDRVLGDEFFQWIFDSKIEDVLTDLTCDSLFKAAADLFICTDFNDERLELIPNFLLTKRSFVLRATDFYLEILERTPSFQNDKEIVLKCLNDKWGNVWKKVFVNYINPALFNDVDVIRSILNKFLYYKYIDDIDLPFSHLPLQFSDNREIALLACQSDEKFFNDIKEYFKTDIEFLIEVSKRNLKFNDQIDVGNDILLKIVEKNPLVYQILSQELKDNRRLALNFVRCIEQGHEDFETIIPAKFLTFDFYIEAIQSNPQLIVYREKNLMKDLFSELIKKEPTLFHEMCFDRFDSIYKEEIKKNPSAFVAYYKHAIIERFRSVESNELLISIGFRLNPNVILFLPDHLKYNKQIILNVMKKDSSFYKAYVDLLSHEIELNLLYEINTEFSNYLRFNRQRFKIQSID